MEYKVFFTVSTHVVKKGDAVVGERRENAQVEAAFEVWPITAFTQAKEEEVAQNQSSQKKWDVQPVERGVFKCILDISQLTCTNRVTGPCYGQRKR